MVYAKLFSQSGFLRINQVNELKHQQNDNDKNSRYLLTCRQIHSFKVEKTSFNDLDGQFQISYFKSTNRIASVKWGK